MGTVGLTIFFQSEKAREKSMLFAKQKKQVSTTVNRVADGPISVVGSQ